jgi:hypothetical protein
MKGCELIVLTFLPGIAVDIEKVAVMQLPRSLDISPP